MLITLTLWVCLVWERERGSFLIFFVLALNSSLHLMNCNLTSVVLSFDLFSKGKLLLWGWDGFPTANPWILMERTVNCNSILYHFFLISCVKPKFFNCHCVLRTLVLQFLLWSSVAWIHNPPRRLNGNFLGKAISYLATCTGWCAVLTQKERQLLLISFPYCFLPYYLDQTNHICLFTGLLLQCLHA